MTDVQTVVMPDLGEGLTESDLVEWAVAVGETVELNQVVAEVETAKALVQLPSPYAGRVAELLVEAGTTVPVGAPLLTIAVEEAAAGNVPSGPPGPSAVEEAAEPDGGSEVGPSGEADGAAPARTSVLVGYGPLVEASSRPGRRPRSAGWSAAHVTTGDGEAAAPDAARDVRIPVTGVRKQMAAAMVASAFSAPHASAFLTVDVTPSVDLVAELRAEPTLEGHHVTILTLVAKAVTIAVERNPSLNAHWDEAAAEIVRFGHVDLGIATATPRGLIVPNVKDADRLRLPALSDAIRALTETARAGTATPAELAGGTITITNVGVFGVDGGTPILVPGQAAILAMGAVRRRPWEHDGQVALRDVMTLTVSFDHRIVDGAEASHFLTDVGAILARPGSVLAMV